MQSRPYLYLLSLAALVSLGCSNRTVTALPEPIGREIEYIELYMSRASSSGTEFEQYKVSPGGIYMECGDIYRGRPTPVTQDFKNSSPELLNSLTPLAEDIISTMKKDPQKLEAPGKSNSMFDPGILNLSIGIGNDKLDLHTSVDAAVNAINPLERKIKRLIQTIRNRLGNSDCGKNDFYGIPPV